jgi:stress-induced morphogen
MQTIHIKQIFFLFFLFFLQNDINPSMQPYTNQPQRQKDLDANDMLHSSNKIINQNNDLILQNNSSQNTIYTIINDIIIPQINDLYNIANLQKDIDINNQLINQSIIHNLLYNIPSQQINPSKFNNFLQNSNTSNLTTTHKITYSTKEPFSCSVCLKRFKTQKGCKIHQNSHYKNCSTINMSQKEKKLNCPNCPKKFTTSQTLKQHIKENHTPKEEKQFDCPNCFKKFATLRLFNQHIKESHTPEEEKQFNCSHCSKKFAGQYLLNRHTLLKHTPEEEKKFNCPNCSKRFVAQSLLNRHINRHEIT